MFLKKINKNISISIFTLMLANTTIPTIHALGENKEINLTLSFQEEQSESIKILIILKNILKNYMGMKINLLMLIIMKIHIVK